MKKRTVILWSICFGLLTSTSQARAVSYSDISGNIFYESTHLCAMALANGQYMFTCSGDGSDRLTVALDTNGEITLYGFASGFAPYKAVLTPPEATGYTIHMERPEAGSRTQWVEYSTTATDHEGWVTLSGIVYYLGTPLCAMALSNGQHMFTCGENLGTFTMDVPLDENGEITLYSFASGFQPWKEIFCGAGVCARPVIPPACPIPVRLKRIRTHSERTPIMPEPSLPIATTVTVRWMTLSPPSCGSRRMIMSSGSGKMPYVSSRNR